MKAIFILMIVIDTSLIAWIFKNFEDESIGRLYVVVGIIFALSVVIGLLFTKILKEIKRLKDL